MNLVANRPHFYSVWKKQPSLLAVKQTLSVNSYLHWVYHRRGNKTSDHSPASSSLDTWKLRTNHSPWHNLALCTLAGASRGNTQTHTHIYIGLTLSIIYNTQNIIKPDLSSILFCQRGDQSSQRQTAQQGSLTFTGHAVRGGANGERTGITYSSTEKTSGKTQRLAYSLKKLNMMTTRAGEKTNRQIDTWKYAMCNFRTKSELIYKQKKHDLRMTHSNWTVSAQTGVVIILSSVWPKYFCQ